MKTLIIVGSSRNDGDTYKVVDILCEFTNYKTLDLNDFKFSYYDYQHKNQNDDFLKIIKEVIKYDFLLFVSPVYWYSMSGIMKVFFDRFTDLITIEKDLGRKLKGKKMAVISCSNGDNLGDNFWLPFIETANFLNINYIDNLHTINFKNNKLLIQEFISNLENKINEIK